MNKLMSSIMPALLIGVILTLASWFVNHKAPQPYPCGSPTADCDVSVYGRGFPLMYYREISYMSPISKASTFAVDVVVWSVVGGAVVIGIKKIRKMNLA